MMKDKMKVVPKDDRRLALVIVDVQKKFIVDAKDTTLESVRCSKPLMNEVIEKFREAGRPVIWILYEGKTHIEGVTNDSNIMIDGFDIADSDIVVRKYHMNSFYNTNLADVVKSYDCDAILLMGMYAQHCVMATYWGAFDQGLSPYLMKGGLISTDQKYCELAVELCKHFTMEELESNLEIHGKK